MTAKQAIAAYIAEHGLPCGTSLENKITFRLHRWGVLGQCQYRVGRYRLDFAWPDRRVAVEADGPHHWRPDVAMKDAVRDSWLRSRGWLVFRVDEMSGNLEEQLVRVVEVALR